MASWQMFTKQIKKQGASSCEEKKRSTIGERHREKEGVKESEGYNCIKCPLVFQWSCYDTFFTLSICHSFLLLVFISLIMAFFCLNFLSFAKNFNFHKNLCLFRFCYFLLYHFLYHLIPNKNLEVYLFIY